jgi:hypothetical protein
MGKLIEISEVVVEKVPKWKQNMENHKFVQYVQFTKK